MVKVKPTETKNKISVKSSIETNVFSIKDNLSEFYAKLSENWASSPDMVNGIDYSSKYYAEQSKASAQIASDIKSETQALVDGFDNNVQIAKDDIEQNRINSINAIDNTYSVAVGDMHEKSDEVLTSIEALKTEAVDSINSTKTTILNDIEFVADGEKQEINELADVIKDNADSIINRVGLNMFDTVVKDHILTYEESKGLALQGTYAYKTAIAGERWGYPDFYAKVVQKYNEATATETVNGVTVKVHSNGHKFYNIADKTGIDEFFNTMGSAWFYGVDIENERVFLPRNNYFDQATGDVSEVGLSVEAGLPNITGDASLNIKRNASGSSGAVSIENATGCVTTEATSQMPYYTSGGTTSNAHPYVLGIDASLSNPIYGNSDTVQPNAVKKLLYICVGNTVSDTSWVDVVTQVKGGVKDLEDKKNASIAEIDANAKSYDNLTKRQITNCLLEVPQRIKYELNEGTLTIKAGSVVIVPYGTEDLTAQYPKGATFLHENFKVYDTQFADGKFFVWAELVSDVTKLTTVTDTSMRLLELIINENSFMHMFNTTSGTNSSSFTGVMYRTDLNRVNEYASGTQKSAVVSLPLLLLKANGSYLSGSVENVFNGFGYIGSTVWVDKGVKALLANGRNEDNSLKSLEITTSKINMVTEGSTAKASAYVLLSETGTLFMRTNNPTRYYDGKLNYFITDGQPATCCVCAMQTHDNTSKILSLDVKTPFRVADYNDLPFIGVCESKATTAGGATKERPAVIVRNYRAGSSWYRVWSDGWIEQGGIVNIPAYTTSATKELTVLENFSDTNYSVFTQMSSGSTNWANVSTNVEGKTTSGFEIRCYQASGTGASIKTHNITWFACGY